MPASRRFVYARRWVVSFRPAISDPTDLDDRRLATALPAPHDERAHDDHRQHSHSDLDRGRARGLCLLGRAALELTELRLDVRARDLRSGCCCAHFRPPFGVRMKLRNTAATARLTTSTIAYGAHDQL